MDSPAPPPVNATRLQRLRPWAMRAVFEGALIIFSVLIALAVSNWAEDRKTAQRVAEMRVFVREEIQANRAILLDSQHIPHHEKLRVAFAEVGGFPGSPFKTELVAPALTRLFQTGLHPAPVRSVVWSSLASGDLLEHMAPRDVFMLSELYRQQENLEGLNKAGYQNILPLIDLLADDSQARPRMVQTMAYLEDMVAQERSLVASYDKALQALDD